MAGERAPPEAKKAPTTVWFALKKSLHCKSEPSQVHIPKPRSSAAGGLAAIATKKAAARSGCSRSIANLKDVIHGSKRHLEAAGEKPANCSPRSIGSTEFLNPIAHEVVLSSSSKCELRITGYKPAAADDDIVSSYFGTLRPGTPGPGWLHMKKSPSLQAPERESARHEQRFSNADVISCHRCGDKFGKLESLEEHHLSMHALTELAEGDSSRKIVEIICRTSLAKAAADGNAGGGGVRIDRVLKVHNTQRTLARFEEYREAVKAKAAKLPKKHPRCLADGNELLRFHGAAVACSLGAAGGSSFLCSLDRCGVCRIIRHGFSGRRSSGFGVFTASTSGRAFEAIEAAEEDLAPARKALLVCRVIAGRVHRPVEKVEDFVGVSPEFDSLAGKVGPYANIEELYFLNARALLPCFLVICKS